MVDLLSAEVKRVLVKRLDEGDDIIHTIKRMAVEQGIKSAFFYALGAISKVVYSVYSPEKNAYANFEEAGFFEITSCIGDITQIVDDEGSQVDTFIHAHITFSGKNGVCRGGHLQPGSSVKPMGEVIIFELNRPIQRLQSEIKKRGYSPIRFQ